MLKDKTISLGNRIGYGGTCDAYVCKWGDSQQPVVIKTLRQLGDESVICTEPAINAKEDLRNEAAALTFLADVSGVPKLVCNGSEESRPFVANRRASGHLHAVAVTE
jgi:hypothetical protein